MSLPGRVTTALTVERTQAINDFADALRFVEWEQPDQVFGSRDWLAFHVFGPGHRTNPDLSGYRRLIVSPFLNEAGLATAWPDGAGE